MCRRMLPPASFLETLITATAACLIVASAAIGGVDAHRWLERRGFNLLPDGVVLVSVFLALLLAGFL